MTASDAERYFRDYEAIQAIGVASRGRGVVDGNGISVKLSALHPRYTWSQRERVLGEHAAEVEDPVPAGQGATTSG